MKINIRLFANALIIACVVSIAFKIKPTIDSFDSFLPEKVFQVDYDFKFKGNSDNIFLRSFKPLNNERQRFYNFQNTHDSLTFNNKGLNTLEWRLPQKNNSFYNINYSYIFKSKSIIFDIPNNLELKNNPPQENITYIQEQELIESKNEKIISLAQKAKEVNNDLKSTIKYLFDYTQNIPKAPIVDKNTSALETLENNSASSRGKSRLFIALCRSLNIPARLKGGIVVNNSLKHFSHVWTEVFILNTWVPFDVSKGHFAYLPSSYLELYTGNKHILTHSPDLILDFNFNFSSLKNTSIFKTDTESLRKNPFTLLKLYESNKVSDNVFFFLLLLPLGGLIISILKNVIGIKTFGIFLPVLIAFTLSNTGFWVGLIIFLLVLILVASISLPLNKWGLLYTPKIAIILSITVIFSITLLSFAILFDNQWILNLTSFPIIIIAIVSERFSRAIDEEGMQNAISKMFQTLIVMVFCYLIFDSIIIRNLLILYPEVIVLTIAINFLLGKWIGVRLIEFFRFKHIIK